MSVASIRPLYSLLGAWTVFFIGPEGRLSLADPMIYITALAIPFTFFLVNNRRLLLLGYGWVFCAFLPQSLSGQSQFQGDMLVNSLSRHLYLPSIGASLVLALLLVSLREKISLRLFSGICIIALGIYCSINYMRVHERGTRWQREGEYVARFIHEIKRILPVIPPNSYITVSNPPEGRAFIQASLRAFYRNPGIYWKDSFPELMMAPADAYGISVEYDWVHNWRYGRPGRAYIVKSPGRTSQ
jgi:hypothetical protein